MTLLIDWQRVVLNLRRAGLNARDVARHAGVTPSAVYQWARGGNGAPADLGVMLRLLDLHLDHCPERHTMEALSP